MELSPRLVDHIHMQWTTGTAEAANCGTGLAVAVASGLCHPAAECLRNCHGWPMALAGCTGQVAPPENCACATLPPCHPSCGAGCRQHVSGQTGRHLGATRARGPESTGRLAPSGCPSIDMVWHTGCTNPTPASCPGVPPCTYWAATRCCQHCGPALPKTGSSLDRHRPSPQHGEQGGPW